MKRFRSVLLKSCLCAVLTFILAASPALADSENQRPAGFGLLLQAAQAWLSSWFVPPVGAFKDGEDGTNEGGGGGTGIPVGENPGLMPMWGSCIDPQGLCGV